MVCDQAGAHQVTACDDSRAMIDVARDVLAANGCQGRITLYNKHSTSLQIPDDLPKRFVDVPLTVIGYFFFVNFWTKIVKSILRNILPSCSSICLMLVNILNGVYCRKMGIKISTL